MTKQVNIHIINNYIYFTSNDDLGVNKPFYGYCWNWWNKIHYFKNGLNENARGRKGIEKIIATNNPEYKDLPSIPKEWLIDKCKTYYDKGFLSSTEEYYDFDKNNFPKTINLEIYESYSDGEDYQLYDYKLKNNYIVIVEKDKQETWQDILNEFAKFGKGKLGDWLIKNFEVPKRK